LWIVKAGATGKFGHSDPLALMFWVKLPMYVPSYKVVVALGDPAA
jgi:hypothetical protein